MTRPEYLYFKFSTQKTKTSTLLNTYSNTLINILIIYKMFVYLIILNNKNKMK